MQVVQFPQSNPRMVPASERLHQAIIERCLIHANDSDLNRHIAAAIARDTPRGWRIDKARGRSQIDAVIALAMAGRASRAEPRAGALARVGLVR
jgi:phage terminase large subunit-like protein